MPDPIRNALLTARSVKPTEAQKEAGNYKKHHVKWNGLDIAIENPKGSIRSGQDHNGKRWSVKMPAHYGYIKRTEGADGDHVDVYLGPDLNSQRVFIVNQCDHNTDKFDEHKCMIGFPNFGDARRAYVAGFSDGKGAARIGSIKELNVAQFKDWLKDEDKTKRIARADGGKIDRTKTGYTFKDVQHPHKLMKPGDWNKLTTAQKNKDWKTAELPIRSLCATQEHVNPDFKNTKSNHKELPFVMKKNGNYFVQDGHHRITALAEEGKQTAKVRLVSLDHEEPKTYPLLPLMGDHRASGGKA